jgi:hypothetical protein
VTVLPIVGVHGVWNYRPRLTDEEATERLNANWAAALTAKLDETIQPRFHVAYYAPIVGRHSRQGNDDALENLTDEQYSMLVAWVSQVVSLPDDAAQASWSIPARILIDRMTENQSLRPALRAFVDVFLREVSAYLDDRSDARAKARECVARTVLDSGARVVIAHSLGSVVAYEALWHHPEISVDLFMTVGSPLAMGGLVFDRISPSQFGRGRRPPNVRRWANLADPGDVVAVPIPFTKRFDVDANYEHEQIGRVNFHGVKQYLQARSLHRELEMHVHQGCV